MKKISFKLIASILTLAIILASFSSIGFVFAAETEVEPTNLIAGKLPTDFYRAVIGKPQEFNYGTTSVAYGPSGLNPYNHSWTDYKEAFSPYLTTATDSDSESGNAYNLGQSFVLIYELDTVSHIDEFAIKIGTHAENKNSAIVKVYTAAERSAIFSANPTATLTIDWAAGSSATLDVTAKYVAVVIEATTGTTKDYFAIRNIALNVYPEVSQNKINLVSGKLPTDFYRAVTGTPQEFNYGVTSVANGPTGLNPYKYNWTDYKEAIAPYLATATDSDAEVGNAYNLGQSFVLIYELDAVSHIDEFAIKIGTHAENKNSAIVKVYTATERSAIFSATPTATLTIDWAAGSSATLDVTAKYVAVVIEATTGTQKNYFAIRDIAINSIVADDDSSDGEEIVPDVNLLSGLIPVAGYPVNDGTTTFSYAQIRTRNASDAWISTRYGYGSVPETCPNAEFASAMALFTDGNVSTSKYLANERKDYEDVLIAYKLKKLSVINSISLDSGDSIPRGTKVYISNTYDTLFKAENLVGTYTYNEVNNKFDIKLAEPKQAEYVGFIFDNSYSNHMTIAEIGAWGYECEYTNLLSGLVPVAGYPVEEGTTKWSYRIIKTRDANGNWISTVENGTTVGGIRYGYNHRPETCPSDAYISAMSLFTDGKIDTSRHLSNEAHQTDDVLIVYKLNNISYINSITLDSGSEIPRGTKIYLSTSYASLFNAANLVGTHTYDTTKNSFEIKLSEDKQALYIGFIFDNAYGKHMTIAEVEAWGKDYPTSNNSVLSGEMVNPTTNEETKNFYGYLKNTSESESVLLGAQINIDEYSDITKRALNDNYYEYIQKTYNATPAIVGTQWKLDVSYYKDYYDEGSIPLISIPGASSPTIDELSYHTGYIKYFDATYVPSASEEDLYYTVQEEIEDCYRNQLDFFQELEAAGVKTYIVRPFIEMNHNDLYGTALINTTKHFKNVWKQMVEYFEDKGLEGIVWAFSPVATERVKYLAPMEYYPGDEYVDIIAPTVYSQTNDAVLPEIIGYDEMIATGKPFALSEVGPVNTYDVTTRTDCMNLLNSLKTTYAEASFINLWYGNNFGISVHENAEQFINDEYIISVDEMEKYRLGYVGNSPVELYASADFDGDTTVAVLGAHTDVSAYASIKIEDGYKVTLYANNDCTGETWIFGKDVADLSAIDVANIGSIKVEKTEAYTVYDVNNDTKTDVKDLVRAKKLMAGIAPEDTNALAADTDFNGKVNSIDLSDIRILLLNN